MGLLSALLLTTSLAAALAGGATADDTPGPVVSFLEPAPPALLQGPTRITIDAAAAPGGSIVSVSLYLDADLIAVLTHPPYTLTWDAGRRMTALRLRAVALDSSGRQGEAILQARVVPIGQVEEVRLVNVYATVRDGRGRPVTGLERSAFSLQEDGVPQTITHFSAVRTPLTIALLIDASSSMRLGDRMEMARRGALQFVDAVEAEDELLVLSFDDTLHGDRRFVSDRRPIKERIAAMTPGGGTALYDAVHSTAGILEERDGRRAMVLLSDGRDQALAENEPGSLHLFEEALERAHRAETAVYAIGLGRHLDTEMDLRRARSVKDILETLARQTGGRSYFPERASQLGEVYRQVAIDLKQQYTLAYTSTNTARDGRFRTIRVTVSDPSLVVTGREGYYAPGPGRP